MNRHFVRIEIKVSVFVRSRTGCILIPHSVEFYQGQSNRLSDRIRFRLRDDQQTQDEDPTLIHQGINGWIYERLAP